MCDRGISPITLGTAKVLTRACFCTDFGNAYDSPKLKLKTSVAFFKKIFDLNGAKTMDILQKNPHLVNYKHVDIQKSVDCLQKFDYTPADIAQNAMILANNPHTLENRYGVLAETGIVNVRIYLLAHYVAVMNQNISRVKAYGYLSSDANVVENLLKHFANIKLQVSSPYSDSVSMNYARELVINAFLKKALGATESDLTKIWKIYPRIRHRSIKTLTRNLALLQSELNFTNEQLLKNAYLLHADPENVEQMLANIPKLGGTSTRDFVYKRPKVLMSTWHAIQEILDILKEFNIPPTAVLTTKELFTLSPHTVRNRLLDLREVKEFQVLVDHPRVLRLILHHSKAQQRLKYLQQLKIKCASLHILSCSSDTFERFAREGADKTKGIDTILFLAKTFQQSRSELRTEMSRHPNWCNVPASTVQSTYDYLIEQGFAKTDIHQNLMLLLYPIKQIEQKLERLETEGEFNKKLTDAQILNLCLYYIELEFHFTGDGIWDEGAQTDIPSPQFEFTESPVKRYRYKVQPTEV